MIPEIPERTSYWSSFIYLIAGLFFLFFPVIGIFNNEVILIARPGGRAHHFHGLDAVIIGLGSMSLGVSLSLSSIKNILERRTQDLYHKRRHSALQQTSSFFKKLGIAILLVWCVLIDLRTVLSFLRSLF